MENKWQTKNGFNAQGIKLKPVFNPSTAKAPS